ncbi:MAG: DUF2232 domain-containing protein [Firmicutes bacterium]|nr:DUF2232 domain-containing protein [Bacillota bacterium]
MNETRSFGRILRDTAGLFLLSVALVFAGMSIPMLGTVAMLLWTLPVILAVYRDGTVPALILSLLLAVLLFFFFGIIDAVMAVGICCVLGLFYGVRLKKKASPVNTLFMGMGIAILLALGYLALIMTLGGMSFSGLKASFEQELFAVYSVYADAGVLDPSLLGGVSAEAFIADMVERMLRILPAFFLIIVIFLGALNYILPQWILKKRSSDILPLPIFRAWHLPWWVLWGIVVALILFIGGNSLDLEILRIIAENIFICYTPILLIAGISLVRYFCVELRLGDGMQALIWICAALFLSVSSIFLVLIGAADAAMDYRAAMEKRKQNHNDGGHKI